MVALEGYRVLPKLNARSIDDPADPLNWPFRPKNDVVPLPLLTADPVKHPSASGPAVAGTLRFNQCVFSFCRELRD
jgi:hypothetical protein